MSNVEFQVDDAAAKAMLSRLAQTVANPGKAALASARALEQNIRQTFRNEVDPWGHPWPAHSPVTVEARKRRGSASTGLLFDTGAMYDSLHSEQQGNDAVVSIGGPDMWPEVHQFGNPNNKAWGRGSAPIPARPFFPITRSGVELVDRWLDAIMQPVNAAIAEAVV